MKSHLSSLLLTAVFVFSCFVAQDEVAAKTLREFREVYRRGKRLAVKRQFRAAIQQYKKALLLITEAEKTAPPATRDRWKQRRVTMYYIVGRTYHFDRQYKQSLRYYRLCLASGPTPRVEKQVKRYLGEVLQKVQVVVYVKTFPRRARVTLQTSSGEQKSGLSPFLTQVESGTVTVKISLQGYITKNRVLSLEAGGRFEQTFRLEKAPKKSPVPPRSRLSSKSSTAAKSASLKLQTRSVSKVPAPPLREAGLWSGVGIGASGLLAGVVLVGLAAADFQTAESMKGNAKFTTENVVTWIDSGNFKQTMGFVALGVGLVGGGVAAYFYFLPKEKKTRTKSAGVSSLARISALQ